MFRKLTPLSLIIISLACIVAMTIGFSAVVTASGENPMRVFTDRSETSVSEVWFPEDGSLPIQIGGGAKVRVAIVVGSERAVIVSCPAGFEPSATRTYIAEPVSMETADGRWTPTVWVLRPTEYPTPEPAAATGELIPIK